MALRPGSLAQTERTSVHLTGTSPLVAYLMLDGGVYKWGAGVKKSEADAFLKDSAGVLLLDSDSTTETRTPYLVTSSIVVI